MKKNIIKESIMDEMCLQVERRGHGNFWLRDTNTSIEFDADVWISDGNVMCSVNSDDKVGSQLCDSKEFEDMCASAVLEEYPEDIPGFDEYVDEVGDYEEAIEGLKCSLTANADTYTKYNARVNQNIKDSGDAASLRFNESKTNKNMKNTVKLNEAQLRKIVAESVKKVLNEEHGWDGMLSGGKVLNGNIKNGNELVDLKLMCEFLRRYVMPNGEEKDGKFIYRGRAVDVTEINRCIHEAICYLNDIVKQFGY